jgi:hypothetical protein
VAFWSGAHGGSHDVTYMHVTKDKDQRGGTKALPYIFASAKHFNAKNSKIEASNMYAYLQSHHVRNLAKIKSS